MNHFGFIAASYALGVAVPVVFTVSIALRLSAARRKLAAIDPRSER